MYRLGTALGRLGTRGVLDGTARVRHGTSSARDVPALFRVGTAHVCDRPRRGCLGTRRGCVGTQRACLGRAPFCLVPEVFRDVPMQVQDVLGGLSGSAERCVQRAIHQLRPDAGATYDELRDPALGRVAVSPDGSVLLYEWSHPYNWAPDVEGLPEAAVSRMQTFMYTVDLPSAPATPESSVPPVPGATYYFGGICPGCSHVAFYEIDIDMNPPAWLLLFFAPVVVVILIRSRKHRKARSD